MPAGMAALTPKQRRAAGATKITSAISGARLRLLALCQVDEDCDGQRILFSQSATGLVWSFPAVLFPNMTVR